MPNLHTAVITTLVMVAFAGNSLLTRIALRNRFADPASFTLIRLIAGTATLWLIVGIRRGIRAGRGSSLSALVLFAYTACFSFAYLTLPAGTGALLLFGAVQATMIGHGLWVGERLRRGQLLGVLLAFGGLVGLLLPGISAPPLTGSLLMLSAGSAWGVYSLRGRDEGDPTRVTAGNFLLAVPLAITLAVFLRGQLSLDSAGVWYAAASGAVTSGIGYAIWYTVLPRLSATQAATVQLSVPVIAAFGGIVFLGEPLSTRLGLASTAVLGGIGMVVFQYPHFASTSRMPSAEKDEPNSLRGGSDNTNGVRP